MDNQVETQDNATKTQWAAGPFTTNRKHIRAWLSQNAARHKRRKFFTQGWRGYVSHRGSIIFE